MKLDEICNGRLEEEIKDGLERLATVATKGATPRIYISASADGNGFVAAGMQCTNGLFTEGLSAFGCDNIPAAVNAVIAKISSPEAIEKRRRELQDKIEKLQAQLEQVPLSPTSFGEMTPGPAPLDHVLYPAGEPAAVEN